MPRASSSCKTQSSGSSSHQTPRPPKQHLCDECDKRFSTSGHLARHQRVHTGEMNHACPFPGCGTRCSRKDNLRQHYRIHFDLRTAEELNRAAPEMKRRKTRVARASTLPSSDVPFHLSLLGRGSVEDPRISDIASPATDVVPSNFASSMRYVYADNNYTTHDAPYSPFSNCSSVDSALELSPYETPSSLPCLYDGRARQAWLGDLRHQPFFDHSHRSSAGPSHGSSSQLPHNYPSPYEPPHGSPSCYDHARLSYERYYHPRDAGWVGTVRGCNFDGVR